MSGEYTLHVAIIDHIRGQRRKGNKLYPSIKPFQSLFVCHIYQGRSEEEGFFLKNMGVVAGVPDILAIWPAEGRGYDIGFIEVKTVGGVLSTPQKRFKWFCERLGIKWALARSVRDAHETFKRWGLSAVHDTVNEPDLRNPREKQRDALKFMVSDPDKAIAAFDRIHATNDEMLKDSKEDDGEIPF